MESGTSEVNRRKKPDFKQTGTLCLVKTCLKREWILKMELVQAFVGLGSNLGDKKANLETAISWLKKEERIDVKKRASYYRTAPLDYTEQDWFVNTVVEIETTLSPAELLAVLLSIEERMGRVRGIFWGPRLIDLDLLLYDDAEINTPGLVIPHPRMARRAFVIIPLAELAPHLYLRGHGKAVQLGAELSWTQEIQKMLD